MGRFINQGTPRPAGLAPKPAHITNPHGWHHTDGSWYQQTVHLGITRSGQHGYGLFTGGTLCWPLNDAEYAALRVMPTRELRAYVNARGFELDED